MTLPVVYMQVDCLLAAKACLCPCGRPWLAARKLAAAEMTRVHQQIRGGGKQAGSCRRKKKGRKKERKRMGRSWAWGGKLQLSQWFTTVVSKSLLRETCILDGIQGFTLHTLLGWYFLCFKRKVTFGHKLHYEIIVTFGEISLNLRQTNWNVVINNVNVVVDELPSQRTVYTCLIIDMWTRRRRPWCHPSKMVCFQWNWRQKFSTLLWTPLACWKRLSESYATHASSCLECEKWP
jgi:hypothetical protein